MRAEVTQAVYKLTKPPDRAPDAQHLKEQERIKKRNICEIHLNLNANAGGSWGREEVNLWCSSREEAVMRIEMTQTFYQMWTT